MATYTRSTDEARLLPRPLFPRFYSLRGTAAWTPTLIALCDTLPKPAKRYQSTANLILVGPKSTSDLALREPLVSIGLNNSASLPIQSQ